jgi:uncharacterized protein HemX
VSQRCGSLSLVRPARLVLFSLIVCLAVAAPAYGAATSTTPAAPVVTAPAPSQPAPAFGPLPPESTPPATTQTQVNTKRPDDTGLGRSTLLLLVALAFGLIIGVGILIWYEGRTGRLAAARRRERLRARRHQPQPVGGPPPPPRKRRAQAAARRKKR